MNILEFELDTLEMDNIGSWPLWIRQVCIMVFCVGVGLLMYYYDIRIQWDHYIELKESRIR